MAAGSSFVLDLADTGAEGPFSAPMCGIPQGDLNMIAMRYQRERSQPAKEAQSKSERLVEREMGPIPAKEVRDQLDAVRGTAAKLHDLLGKLNPKAKRALQAKAEGMDQAQMIGSLDFLLEGLMAATRDAAEGYDPTNGGTTYDPHGPGANPAALTNLVRHLAGRLGWPEKPVSYNEAGELYRLVSTILVWTGDARRESLSESIRKVLERA